MKKLLLLFILLVFPFSSFASFLGNNVIYQKLEETATYTKYFNVKDSVVIRAQDPYYIIQGNIYTDDFLNGNVRKETYYFIYDTEQNHTKYQLKGVTILDTNGNILQAYKSIDAKEHNIPTIKWALGFAASEYFWDKYQKIASFRL